MTRLPPPRGDAPPAHDHTHNPLTDTAVPATSGRASTGRWMPGVVSRGAHGGPLAPDGMPRVVRMDAVQWPPPDAPLPQVVTDTAALERALAGDGPAVSPAGALTGLADGTALVVGTSGSTGTPKLAMLSAGAVRASAAATERTLGGPGRWLLAMPATHVAGLQVLARSLLAGYAPVAADDTSVAAFTRAAAAMTGPRRYSSLVPTQLVRVLDDPAATDAARRLDAILVGGAALAPAVHARAVAAGLRVVRTYGMSETAGGCVYDGVPLDCAQVRVDADGVVSLGGDMVFSGYHGRATPELTCDDGVRWFRTNDLGTLDDGVLTLLGRADDVINTGGLKVAPRVVEEALLADPRVLEACVVGVPDAQWGQAVAAALVLRDGTPTVDPMAIVRAADLPGHARPKRAVLLDAVPLRGPGKPDRTAVAARF